MKQLTEKQKKVLGWIEESLDKTGQAPTVRELQAKIGCAAPMGVVSHLNALESKGYIRRSPGKARGIILSATESGRTPDDMVQVPLVGNVACGMPIWAEEMIEEWIPLSTKLVGHTQDVFMLRAKGDSMNLAGIDEGDYIVFKKQNTALPGEKVVVLLGSEATVKRIKIEKNKVIFEPMSTNKDHKPIVPSPGTFMIQGKVIGVIKNFKD
ncbi:MAG: transcriptional repressor LexA [Patescibacteria group bacterium]|nr:transcriptional repressor LexA [Patescibacteria group bacterium]